MEKKPLNKQQLMGARMVALAQVLGLALGELAKTKAMRTRLRKITEVAARLHAHEFGAEATALLKIVALMIDLPSGPDVLHVLEAQLTEKLQGREPDDPHPSSSDEIQQLLRRASSTPPVEKPARKRTQRRRPKG